MVSAAGVGGGGLNRLGIAAPISGQIIARPVTLGQTVAADAELYRIANLSQVSIALNLKAEDAGRVRPGNTVLRSEEHTSELQSNMRITKGVFCLKKKQQK